MVSKLSKYFILFAFVFIAAININAQSDAGTSNGRAPVKDDVPKNIQETLDKHRIDQAKKDHDEMIERGEEALKLSEELEKSVANNNKISPQEQAKLVRLEKIIKKIRNELGGDDDDGAAVEEKNGGKWRGCFRFSFYDSFSAAVNRRQNRQSPQIFVGKTPGLRDCALKIIFAEFAEGLRNIKTRYAVTDKNAEILADNLLHHKICKKIRIFQLIGGFNRI